MGIGHTCVRKGARHAAPGFVYVTRKGCAQRICSATRTNWFLCRKSLYTREQGDNDFELSWPNGWKIKNQDIYRRRKLFLVFLSRSKGLLWSKHFLSVKFNMGVEKVTNMLIQTVSKRVCIQLKSWKPQVSLTFMCKIFCNFLSSLRQYKIRLF